MAEHTPTPWVAEPDGLGGCRLTANNGPIRVSPAFAHGEGEGSFIVKCVNTHADLVAALKEAQRFMDYLANGRAAFDGPGTPKSCLAMIDAALAKVAAP